MAKIPTKGEISNDVLIRAVRARPMIYDRTEENAHNTTTSRKKMWQEVYKLVFPKVWDSFTTYEKELAGIEVQTRWKNLRNSYSRELRQRRLDIERGKSTKHRKTYMYFNDLSFLNGNCDSKFQNDEDCQLLDDVEADIENTNDSYNDFTTYPAESESRKRKVEEDTRTPFENVETDDAQTAAATHFAMSLVPFLKNVPPEKKIDCEIMVLKVMKKFSSRKKRRCEPLEDPLTGEISQSYIKMENTEG